MLRVFLRIDDSSFCCGIVVTQQCRFFSLLDDRYDDSALPIAAVELGFFGCSVLDEAAPVDIYTGSVLHSLKLWNNFVRSWDTIKG